MTRPVKERIEDILFAISQCERYAVLLDTDDPLLIDAGTDAIERNIAIIGEASGYLPKEVTSQIPGIDWRAAKGIRNKIVHEYFGVDAEIIREVLKDDLPDIRDALVTYRDTHLAE